MGVSSKCSVIRRQMVEVGPSYSGGWTVRRTSSETGLSISWDSDNFTGNIGLATNTPTFWQHKPIYKDPSWGLVWWLRMNRGCDGPSIHGLICSVNTRITGSMCRDMSEGMLENNFFITTTWNSPLMIRITISIQLGIVLIGDMAHGGTKIVCWQIWMANTIGTTKTQKVNISSGSPTDSHSLKWKWEESNVSLLFEIPPPLLAVKSLIFKYFLC